MSNRDPSAPVGVFDSGAGGLSVLHAIRAALPYEDLVYLADTAHVPYGDKSDAYLRRRANLLARFLLEQGAKVIVIACNTATAAAAAYLRAHFPLPIVAMEPAVKPAVAATRTGVVGVMATVGTIRSAGFAALVERFGHSVRVVAQACPGLVAQVEAGDLSGPATRALVEQYTAPLLSAGADVLVLGCTHYPFLAPLIADVVGPRVALVETGSAVAHQLQRVIEVHGLATPRTVPGQEQFWTSGDPAAVSSAIAHLWGRPVEVSRIDQDLQDLQDLQD